MQWTDADIQKYLLLEDIFDLYWIIFRLKKIPITLSPDNVPLIISLSIPPTIKSISSVSNISTNNLFQPPSNSNTPSSQEYRQKLINLAKIFIEAKYSRENNSFSFKLTIFHNICAKTDVSQEILLEIFLTILTSLALNYYYSNTGISAVATFRQNIWVNTNLFWKS